VCGRTACTVRWGAGGNRHHSALSRTEPGASRLPDHPQRARRRGQCRSATSALCRLCTRPGRWAAGDCVRGIAQARPRRARTSAGACSRVASQLIPDEIAMTPSAAKRPAPDAARRLPRLCSAHRSRASSDVVARRPQAPGSVRASVAQQSPRRVGSDDCCWAKPEAAGICWVVGVEQTTAWRCICTLWKTTPAQSPCASVASSRGRGVSATRRRPLLVVALGSAATGTTVQRSECSSVVRVWRANDDRPGEQRVLLDPGYERSRRVVVAHPGHEPAVDADVERRPLRRDIQLERHCADDRQRKPGRRLPDRGGASRSLSFGGDTGPVLLRSDLAASSEPPLQPAARRCTPG
jgi:hypothetical protein